MSVPTTWGLGSLEFLILYGSLCALLRAANIQAWSAVERTAPASHATATVDAYELAMVNGGPRQAITTALTMLTWRGVARAEGPDGTLRVEGDIGADAHPLERAVYEDLRRRGRLQAAALPHEPATSERLEHITTELTGKGLLLDPRYTAWTGRLWLWGPVGLFLVGAVRLLAMWQYIDADTSMRLLLFTTLGAGVVALLNAHDQRGYDGRPLSSERGRSLVEQWRSRDCALIETEDARIAFATALADAEEWDPHRVPCRPPARPSRHADLPTESDTAAARASLPSTDQLLLGEELLLISCARAPDAAPDPTLATRLAAALLIELALRGRIDVEITADAAEVVTVVDDASTGDDLLDEALALLTPGATPPAPAPPRERLWGLAARRRLRSSDRVRGRDIVSWWWGSWTCAEFPALTPTVVQRILSVAEGLRPLEHRVARRLVQRGALRQQLAGRWPYRPCEHGPDRSAYPAAPRTGSESRPDDDAHTHATAAVEPTRRLLLAALTHPCTPASCDLPLPATAVIRAVELIVCKYEDATRVP